MRLCQHEMRENYGQYEVQDETMAAYENSHDSDEYQIKEAECRSAK